MAEHARLAWLEDIIDLADEAFLVMLVKSSRRPRIAYASERFSALTGLAADQALGRGLGLLRVQGTEPQAFARLARAVEEGAVVDVPLTLRAKPAPRRLIAATRPLRRTADARLLSLRAPADHRECQHRRRAQALAEISDEAIYHLALAPDCGLVVDWTSERFLQLVDYSFAELVERGGWGAVVEPDDLHRVQRRMQRLMAGEQAGVDYRVRTRTGEMRWLRDRGQPEWDEDRELVVGALCAARDITDLRRLEERLQHHELDRRALSELASGLVVVLDAEGVLREVSGRLEEALGARLRQGLGQSLFDLLGADSGRAWREYFDDIAPGLAPISFEFEDTSATGADRYRVLLSAEGEGMLAVVQPAPSGLAEAALPFDAQARDPRLHGLLETVPGAALLISPALLIEDLNSEAERLTGSPRAAAIGRALIEALPLASGAQALLLDLEESVRGAEVPASETWVRLNGGQEARIIWALTPLRAASGHVVAILAQGRGVGERAPSPANDRSTLRGIIDQLADGSIILTAAGTILALSSSAQVIFGFAQPEIAGAHVERLLASGPAGAGPVLDQVRELVDRPGEPREFLARRKNGELAPVELAGSRVSAGGRRSMSWRCAISRSAGRPRTRSAISPTATR